MAPKLPQQFGSYTLQELIARGGMAEIYRATMPGVGGFEKTVAIKKILPHLAENDEFITMLIDEARIIVSINHANIAQVYDLGKIQEDYYIAMEYIHGIDLSTIVKDLKERNQTVPVDHAVFIASSIAAGLHVAHNKCDDNGRPLNIVHRDVSPHNILISFAGDVKIIDFGVAKARGKEAHTQLGVIKGKLLYMAPEQAMAKELDGRADLFAMGLILYRMLTNHLPFEGDNEFQIYNYILSKEITPPKAFNPQIPEEVNQIVMMLLQRDPSKRYQDGYSAKVDLDRALQNISPGYSLSRLSRWVEDNFSHLAKKNRPKQESGQNDWAPSTPSRNQVGTDQMSASSDDWDVIDEDEEDTVNLSMQGPEAQEVLREAEKARADYYGQQQQQQQGGVTGPMRSVPPGQSGNWGAASPPGGPPPAPPRPNGAGNSGQWGSGASGESPAQNSGQWGDAASGEVPAHTSGQWGAASSGERQAHSSGQFESQNPGSSGQFDSQNPATSGQYQVFQSGRHNPVASGQYNSLSTGSSARTAGSDGQTGPVSQQDAMAAAGDSKKFPVVPAIGILLLLLAIAGMLAYQLLVGAPTPSTDPETPVVSPTVEEPAVPGEPSSDENLAPAEAGEPDAGAPVAEEEEGEVVDVEVLSTPDGAKVFLGAQMLGETPFTGELPKSEEVTTLRLEKEGFKAKDVKVIPFDKVRKNVELDPAEGAPKEEAKPAPKKTTKKTKRRPKRKRRPKKTKKATPKSTSPAVPLLGMDEPAKKDDDEEEEEIIDPFAN